MLEKFFFWHAPELKDLASQTGNIDGCVWGYPASENIATAYATVLTAEQATTVTDFLLAAGYTESEVGGYPALETYYEGEQAGNGLTSVIIDNVWVITKGARLEVARAYIDTAIPNLIAANPSLG